MTLVGRKLVQELWKLRAERLKPPSVVQRHTYLIGDLTWELRLLDPGPGAATRADASSPR